MMMMVVMVMVRRPYMFTMSTFQMAVLLQFNDKEEHSVEALIDATSAASDADSDSAARKAHLNLMSQVPPSPP